MVEDVDYNAIIISSADESGGEGEWKRDFEADAWLRRPSRPSD